MKCKDKKWWQFWIFHCMHYRPNETVYKDQGHGPYVPPVVRAYDKYMCCNCPKIRLKIHRFSW